MISNKLKPYVPIADMLVKSFGGTCEVVIHDLSIPQKSVVYVANGKITNRRIGQSFDHLIRDVLLSDDFNNDYKANYIFELETGEKIKSSTSLIRDENQEVIGAFCVNFKMEGFYQMQSFLNGFLCEEENTEKEESLETYQTVNEIIDYLIDKSIGNADLKKLSRSQNIDIVRFLFDKGVFLAKGSVDKVAEKMNISTVTVYAYLDEIKKTSI